MKKILEPYAAYNYWANSLLANAIGKLSEEKVHQEIISSYRSIFKTVLHMWDAESIWWQRVKLADHIEVPSVVFSGDTEALLKGLLQQSLLWKEWIAGSRDSALEHEFIYRNTRKEQFKQPVAEVAQHLFNHQSYHRGQLITMLRQVGEEQVPGTDYIIFLRKK